ncbi:hypothetical protein COT77_00795 [Candidatus Berkelbacteria bacterium CG10_big_fil_rev_8_21_14_0_10_41_12]|uniref:Uncharacterized protein n=1 Tax=Candidatus Berkelbacteria bacterium CG10_big_fil_rev_8_21_14_0_10_41_12 TaxID=1974513 RepID=A0A2M6WXN1_9BACT|nr:MAG: hypothetical protein COT77_00795 [Candidatus Berkelbacteria bacterium CG10_big_fil_rev_8_21_14_0_10_41_12]
MNKNAIISFITGFCVFAAVFVVIVFFISREPKINPPDVSNYLSDQTFSELKKSTNGLEKYGDLPVSVTSDEVGRENPFSAY